MKGLIVAEPWISLILSGEKTWEMRSSVCNHRGRVGLIRKGSGHVVGITEITGSLPALDTLARYAEAEPMHRIPSDRQGAAFSGGWRTPWVMKNTKALKRPVHYRHKSGTVIWVKELDPEVIAGIEAQL